MKFSKFLLIFFIALFFDQQLISYNLPYLNLGITNFLDGGPLRPKPGWYWIEETNYYYSNNFVDNNGKTLPDIICPNLKVLATVPEIVYQTNWEIFLHGKLGFFAEMPLFLFSTIDKTKRGITNSGSGFGDIDFGAYLQWDTIHINDRPLFAHRYEFIISVPSGKNEQPQKNINPGNGFFILSNYWAATLYFTPSWALSWRTYYTWSFTNRKTKIKAGDAFNMNFIMQYEPVKDCWIGLAGYFLQQLKNDKKCGVEIPHSRERVLGLGPGLHHQYTNDLHFFAYLYFESLTRNRPEGISFVFNWLYHF